MCSQMINDWQEGKLEGEELVILYLQHISVIYIKNTEHFKKVRFSKAFCMYVHEM